MSIRPIIAGIRSGAGEPESEASAHGERFREALALWASGVTVLAVDDEGDRQAMVVSAFTSVSLEPPLVLVCVRDQANILPSLLEVGRFTVNLLGAGQRRLVSQVVNGLPVAPDDFAEGGDPVLRGALASLVCSTWQVYPGGDHRIVVGAVERVELGPPAPPLLHFRREYRALDG